MRRSRIQRLSVMLGATVVLLLAALAVNAEDGYRLWLRYDLLPAPQLDQYRLHLTSLVVPGQSATSEIIRNELSQGLEGLLGKSLPLTDKVDRNGALVVITAN